MYSEIRIFESVSVVPVHASLLAFPKFSHPTFVLGMLLDLFRRRCPLIRHVQRDVTLFHSHQTPPNRSEPGPNRTEPVRPYTTDCPTLTPLYRYVQSDTCARKRAPPSWSVRTLCVHHGVDVMSVLSSLPLVSLSEGAAQSVSKTASCVGGAMLCNTFLLPFRIVLLGRFGKPAFAELERRQESLSLRIRDGEREYRSWYRRRLHESPGMRQLARRAASDASARNGPSATG